LPPKIEAGLRSAISGPLVEECAKGLALVAAFVLSHWAFERFGFLEFEGVTDGIVYGAAVGLGFAFTEDLLYLWTYTSALGPETGLNAYLGRVDFFGVGQLYHPVYTATLGVRLGLATWSRSWKGRVGFPVLGLAAAIAAVRQSLPARTSVASMSTVASASVIKRNRPWRPTLVKGIRGVASAIPTGQQALPDRIPVALTSTVASLLIMSHSQP
jgi:RsiW-degrading membrane proteinase PrsW (M82 family)